MRIWHSPEFDPATPEGQDAIAPCDFVIESGGKFYPGHYGDDVVKVLCGVPISKPISGRVVTRLD